MTPTSGECGARTLLLTGAAAERDAHRVQASDILLLAKWCDPAGRLRAAGATCAPEPWSASTGLDEARQEQRRLVDMAIPVLAEKLCSHHGARWSERAARMFLGPWIEAYVSVAVDRWARLLTVSETSSLAPRTASLGRDCWVTPPDTLHAMQLLKSDEYNWQLMSRMAETLGIPATPVVAAVDAEEFAGVLSPSAMRAAADHAVRAMARLRRTVLHRGAHFPSSEVAGLAWATAFRALPVPASRPARACGANPALRHELGPLDLGTGEFEGLLAVALIADVPTCFLEGYEQLSREARALGSPPKAILSANSYHYDEAFKCWASESASRGSLVLGAQHGGNYGVDAYNLSERHERSVTDGYYSWGWEDPADHRVIPMPAAKLLDTPRRASSAHEQSILYVGTVRWRYPMQLGDDPGQFERYLGFQRRFLTELDDRLAEHLRFRPHREDGGWPVIEGATAARPGLVVEDWQRPFSASLRECRVFVCDHLSTTFAEALSARVPTILFWEPELHEIRPSAAPFVDALRRVGVLHDTPEAAAAELRVAYADIETWWNDPDRQQAVAEYCERFARTRPDGARIWARELKRVALSHEA